MMYDDLEWNLPGGMVILYAFATAVLFHAALVEPQKLPLAYSKFLNKLTGGCYVAMDRRHLEIFNYNSFQQLQNIVSRLNLNPCPKYSLEIFGTVQSPFQGLNSF